ncbi:hypothetical protein ACJX0J_020479, partial [Zea mays]
GLGLAKDIQSHLTIRCKKSKDVGRATVSLSTKIFVIYDPLMLRKQIIFISILFKTSSIIVQSARDDVGSCVLHSTRSSRLYYYMTIQYKGIYLKTYVLINMIDP